MMTGPAVFAEINQEQLTSVGTSKTFGTVAAVSSPVPQALRLALPVMEKH